MNTNFNTKYIFQCFIHIHKKIIAFDTNDPLSTVRDIKQYVEDKQGFHINNQRVVYCGKTLKDVDFANNTIQHNSTIHILQKH